MLLQHAHGLRASQERTVEALTALAHQWRERATELRTWAAAEGSAVALEGCARELEDALRAAQDALLTVSQAASESGYSERRLRELLAEGKIPNAGQPGASRIRRADIPRKPRATNTQAVGVYDVAADAASLIGKLGAS